MIEAQLRTRDRSARRIPVSTRTLRNAGQAGVPKLKLSER
jgi:hypothetical protein